VAGRQGLVAATDAEPNGYDEDVFLPIDYLEFASRWFGRVRYDLASSGLEPIAPDELGTTQADDAAARARFRAALAERYAVPEVEVVPALGGSGALFAAYATLLDPGSRALVELPGYEPLWRVPEALGAHVDRFERRSSAGYSLEAEAVLERLCPETRVVAISNPHNPSGGFSDQVVLTALATALSERGVWLLVDEVYVELVESAVSARRLAPNVIACSSATKAWGVPWARAGWLFAPEELATRAERIERYVCGNAPPSAWSWGVLALEHVTELEARREALQSGKRALVERFASRYADTLEWSAPHAESLFGWFRDRRGQALLQRIERAASERSVVVAPGEFFGEPGAFRLSWTCDRASLEPGLAELAAALEL
jgi:aspartate/methionine/tyrosine aminotransferase